MTKKLAVLGSPIAHSLSPVIQMAALNSLAVDATFEKFETDSLAQWLSRNQDFDALSLTMPLKEQYPGVAETVDLVVEKARSANYLLKNSSGWHAYNTDVFGITQAVKNFKFESLGILGTGATARSALVAFDGMKVNLWGRNQSAVADLSAEYSVDSVGLETALSSDLVVSTLPANALLELPINKRPGVLLDVVYSRPSPAGYADYASGIEMLIWQAIGQLRLLINGTFQPFEDEEVLYEQMKLSLELAE
jgi:shikimate dehydrogenase